MKILEATSKEKIGCWSSWNGHNSLELLDEESYGLNNSDLVQGEAGLIFVKEINGA